MAGVRVTMASFPGGQASPEYYDDSDTFASPTAAVAGVASGFLIINPDDTEVAIALSVASIKTISQK